MSKPGVREIQLDASAGELIHMAALGVGIVLKGEVIGFIMSDADGVSVVPKPGLGLELMQALSNCDWKTQVRLAEEWQA